jgi:hypothetical protein
MAPFIATTVQWVILPLIMRAIFAFAWIIASSAKTGELKVSSWAGFWAGLLTFVTYIVLFPTSIAHIFPGRKEGPLSSRRPAAADDGVSLVDSGGKLRLDWSRRAVFRFPACWAGRYLNARPFKVRA